MEWGTDAPLKGKLKRVAKEFINAKQPLPSLHAFNKHLLSPVICRVLPLLWRFNSDLDPVLALQTRTGEWGIETSKQVGGLAASARKGVRSKKRLTQHSASWKR